MSSADSIGIDLGTTYSCVAGYINSTVEVICNLEGKPTTPSVVSIENDIKLVGEAALYKKTSDPGCVFYDAKRLIGRSFDDPVIQKFFGNWPFRLARWDHNAKKETNREDPNVVDNIKYKYKEKLYEPVQISAYILQYLKESAEAKLSRKITKAVITVPAHFKDSQRQSTKAAGMIAGFKDIRLLNEPTAAALAYGFKRGKGSEERVLVFDLGGGTFDVSCLNFEPSTDQGGLAETLATEGDTFLGGRDFDNELYNYAVKIFSMKNKIAETQISDKAKRRLRIECEKAKRTLSSTNSVTLEIDYFYEDLDLSVEITRANFEQMCMKYFTRCIDRVKGLLMFLGKVNPEYSKDGVLLNEKKSVVETEIKKIDRVILVGGSSRIPRVQQMLREIFSEEKVTSPVHPDEAVAFGAAFHAALVLSPGVTKESESILLMDTVPLDLGVETAGGVFTALIKRNSTIPIKQTQLFTTYADNQSAVTVNIYEGVRPMVKDNTLLGSFNLSGIANAPRGVPQIEITYDVDNNGCLTVTAVDKSSSNKKDLSISNLKGKMSDEDINRMVEEAERFKEIDEAVRRRVEKRNELDSLVVSAKGLGCDVGEIENWMVGNPEAEIEVLEEKIGIVNNIISSKKNNSNNNDNNNNNSNNDTDVKVDE